MQRQFVIFILISFIPLILFVYHFLTSDRYYQYQDFLANIIEGTLVSLSDNGTQQNYYKKENLTENHHSKGNLTELTNINQFVDIEPPNCVALKTFYGGVNTRMCVKPVSTDVHVSGSIVRQGAWEFGTVNNLVKIMTTFPGATFLDIGCNIGMYTVVVAAMRRQVVAVDADPVNLAYVRKSLDLTNNTQFVRIIYNSVSDIHETLYPYAWDKTNQGGTSMLTETQLKKRNFTATGPAVESRTMMDILNTIQADTVILKIDVEGYECKALQPTILLGESGKTIPYIFMEWGQLPHNNNTCPQYKEWVQLFYTGGYYPANPETLAVLETETLTKSIWDILWVHGSVKSKNGQEGKF